MKFTGTHIEETNEPTAVKENSHAVHESQYSHNATTVFLTEIECDGKRWNGPEIEADTFEEAYVKAESSGRVRIVGSFLR